MIGRLAVADGSPGWGASFLALSLTFSCAFGSCAFRPVASDAAIADRKSTRLNSSHLGISYAVFCLKKNVVEIVFAALLDFLMSVSVAAPAVDLCPAGDTRRYAVAGEVAVHCLFVFFLLGRGPQSFPLFPYPRLFA